MLTGFQLRAARSCLSLYLKDVTNSLGIHASTLTRLEANTPNLSYINSNTRTSLLIQNFYQGKGIIFPYYNSIVINYNNQDSKLKSRFSRFKLKISRIALRMSRKELGAILNLPESSIAGWENEKDLLSTFSPQDTKIVDIMKMYFQNKGISYKGFNIVELLDDPVDKSRK
jgi:DNA-binding XRE family transcriptional regulator